MPSSLLPPHRHDYCHGGVAERGSAGGDSDALAGLGVRSAAVDGGHLAQQVVGCGLLVVGEPDGVGKCESRLQRLHLHCAEYFKNVYNNKKSVLNS